MNTPKRNANTAGGEALRGGFSVAEMLVVLTLIAVMIPPLIMLSQAYEKKQSSKMVNLRVKTLQEVVRTNYQQVLSEAENRGCYGWGDAACQKLSLTPLKTGSDTLIRFYGADRNLGRKLASVGCTVSPSVGNIFTVSCPDKTGRPLKLKLYNWHSLKRVYSSPYAGRYFRIDVESQDGGYKRTINIDPLIRASLSKTDEKLITIGNAIKRFVREIRIRELNNDCGSDNTGLNPPGGLGSWDDPLVPWSWELVSSRPYTLCQGQETSDGCGCTNFNSSSIWNKSGSYCTIDTNGEIGLVFRNLRLGSYYKTDGFGNPITIVPLADSNGAPSHCPPPRPKPGYPEHGTLGKVRVGIFDFFPSARFWAHYVDVYTD